MALHYYKTKADIPLSKRDKYVRDNDAYFALVTIDKVDERVNHLLKNTDDIEYIDNRMFKDKYGYHVDWLNLSTGGKTILNIFYNQDSVFDTVECGENAIKDIFSLSLGSCVGNGPGNLTSLESCDFIINDNYVIKSIEEYKRWCNAKC